MAFQSSKSDKQVRLDYMVDEINNIEAKITDLEDYYDFTNDNRGVALIFNHEFSDERQRKGTQKDCHDLKDKLENLEFEVRIFNELNLKDIRKTLYKVSKEDHSNNDCLLVAVMTHGKENGQISAADLYYDSQELWENFLGSNCESLVGKPKLFFIQACRGGMVDPGVLLKSRPIIEADAYSENDILIPNFADFLIMYSTSEGYRAYRDRIYGSFFIQSLCEELMAQDDLMRILMRVNRKVAIDNQLIKQMPNIVSMLTKLIFFSKTRAYSSLSLNCRDVFNLNGNNITNFYVHNTYNINTFISSCADSSCAHFSRSPSRRNSRY